MSGGPLHSVSVAGVALDDAGRVLLIRRRDNGQWQAPGGVLELEETPEEGVVREVLEETGVHVEVERLAGVYKNMTKGVVALVYRCKPLGGQAGASEEAAETAWMATDSLDELMTPAFAVRVLDALVVARCGPASRSHDGTHLL